QLIEGGILRARPRPPSLRSGRGRTSLRLDAILPPRSCPKLSQPCPTPRNLGAGEERTGESSRVRGEAQQFRLGKWRPHRDSNCTEPANRNPATTHAKAEFARESEAATVKNDSTDLDGLRLGLALSGER